jgi:Sap-like sulfolipid-1-addressing protein
MGTAIGELLPAAVGVALSPVPVIVVILMLFSRHATANSLAFLLGWVGGLALVSALVLTLAYPAGVSANGQESVVGATLRLTLGGLLLLFAYRQWRKRPAVGEKAELPSWMNSIESVGMARAFGLGGLLSGVNVKNVMLTLAAALSVSEAGLGTAQSIGALAIFIVIGSLSVAAPVAVNLVLGERAARPLGAARAWLEANNSTIMCVLLLILGVAQCGKALGALVR